MKLIKKFNKRYELYKIEGKIEVLGESSTNSGSVDQAKSGNQGIMTAAVSKDFVKHRKYDYIRMSQNGEVVMIKKVSAANLVDSYLQPGLHCELYLLKFKNEHIIIAIKTGERFANETDEVLNSIKKTLKKSGLLFILSGGLVSITGIPLVFLLIGFLIIPFGLFIMIMGMSLRSTAKKIPPTQEVIEEIKNN